MRPRRGLIRAGQLFVASAVREEPASVDPMAMLLGLLGAGLGLAARGVPAGVQGNVTFHPPVALGPVRRGIGTGMY